MKKAIIILGFICLLLGIQGCGKEKYDEMAYYTTYQREEVDTSFMDKDEWIHTVECQGDRAIIASWYWTKTLPEGQRRTHLYEMDLETKETYEIDLALISDTELVRDIVLDELGYIYMLSYEQNQSGCYISKIDATRGVLERHEIADVSEEYFTTDGIQLKRDAKNNFYLIGTLRFMVLNEQYEKCCTMNEGEFFYTEVHQNEAGDVKARIMGGEYDGCYIFNTETYRFEETASWGVRSKDGESGGDNFICGDEEFDFYYEDTKDMATQGAMWGIKDNRAYKLFQFNEADVLDENLAEICIIDDKTFLCTEVTPMEERFNGLVILSPANKDTKEVDKIELNMMGYDISTRMEMAVYAFNQQNDTYHINIKDYATEYEEAEEGRKQLSLKLLQPGACDLLVLNRLPKEDYIDKELLTDLSQFINQSSGIQKEDFLDCIMKIVTDENGAMYYMIPEFSIQTMVQKVQPGQAQEEWSFARLTEQNEQLETGQQMFYGSDKTALLERLIHYNPNSLVDMETKTCNFDSEEFRETLRFIKNAKMSSSIERLTIPECVQSGLIKIVNWEDSLFLNIMLIDCLFEGEAEYLGYPTQEGNKPVFDGLGQEFGIVNTSEQKQGAWEFMEYVFASENYEKLFGSEAFPVRKDCLEETIRYLSATEPYTEEDGTVMEPAEIVVGIEEYEFKPGPLTDRHVQIFENLCNNAVYAQTIDEKYMEIILEETERYFNGQKSEDEVVKNLQNRIGSALKE